MALTATPRARLLRAYTISSLVVLLMVVVIFLLVWRAYLIYQGAAASSANVSGNPQVMGYLIGGLLGSLALCVGITAGIGVGSYFVFGKSQSAANGAMDVVLLLAIVVYGFQIYAWLNSPRYAAIQQAQAGGGGPATSGQNKGGPTNGVDNLADRMKAANDRNKEQMDAAAKRSQEQIEAARRESDERARHLREQMQAPQQGRPTGPTLPSTTPTAPNRVPPTSPPPPGAPRPSRPSPMADDPKAVEALAAVRKDADDRVVAVSGPADELLEACRRAPEASYSAIDSRLKQLKSLRQSSTELGRWLGGLDKAADKALADAGVESLGARIRFTGEYRAPMRASACDQIARFCDDAVEEAELLRGKIGKWRLGGDGKVETKDRDLEFKCRSLRSRIESTTSRRSQLVDQLNGR